MPLPPARAISRRTSFVMSSTVRLGSAAAIETGISTLVTPVSRAKRRDKPLPAESAQHFSRYSCGCDLAREAEVDVLARHGHLDDVGVPALRKLLDRGRYELFGRRRAGRQADDFVPCEQILAELALAVDQLRLGARVPRDFDQPLRVGARLGPDHEDERRLLCKPLDCVLTVLGGVADVIGGRPQEGTEPLLERI